MEEVPLEILVDRKLGVNNRTHESKTSRIDGGCEIMLPLVPIKEAVSMMFLSRRRSRALIKLR